MRNITITTRRASTLFAIGILLTLAAALSLIGAVPNAAPAAVSAAVPAQASVDYDSDNDNLIEISGHAQFNAIRHDLDGNGSPASTGATAYNTAFPNAASGMGCAATCIGYELTADINLDTDGNGSWTTADTYWNAGAGWLPIGGFSTSERYSAVLNGNGFAITNLFISRATNSNPTGLFMFVGAGARVESLRITTVGTGVTGNNNVGILAGYNVGEIVAVSTSGAVSTASAGSYAGGLFGQQTSSGTIHSSHSSAAVTGTANVGGLVGYASAGTSASITNSYSTGAVTRSSGTATTIGGLVGAIQSGFTVSASYWDSATSGCATGGSNGCTTSAAGTTQTTSALQTPVGYTGIYAAWNANLDGVTGADDPWYFGTTSQYPVLKYGKIDYDLDNDRYIEVSNLAQLDAVRHDLTGVGNSSNAAYIAAFPLRFTAAGGRMGCPSAGCTGYELTANLDFDENGDGQITAADSTYWNGGAGWAPIGSDSSESARYQGDFKGNGHTINNLFISTGGDDVGLFGSTHNTSLIETLGVTNANVRGDEYVAILVGSLYGDIRACYVTGAVTGTGDGMGSNRGQVGALVGYAGVNARAATVHSSYSHASVTGIVSVGGLVGYGWHITMTNSYSTGRVTRSQGSSAIGGLLGWFNSGTVTASYCDSDTSGQSNCTSTLSPMSGGTAQTTSALKTPHSALAYTGIYSTWNANLDGVDGGDGPWAFGTSSDYPTLVYHIDDVDYDEDNDNLIDVSNLHQLSAMHHDTDGNGVPAAGAGTTAHNSAFPRKVDGLGCPATCAGYELVADLDFDENGDGQITSLDSAFWDTGTGWNPIGDDSSNAYATTFRGNGHTINNLFINRTSNVGNLGLFASIANAGRIESLGVTNASINTGTMTGSYNGILAGNNYGAIVACYTTGSITSNNFVGGLTGFSSAATGTTVTITSSYSTASVTADSTAPNAGGLVGRVSRTGTGTSTIVNSYSTGEVNAAAGGGLVGSNNSGSATASYWDTVTSGRSSSALGAGKTPRELQSVTDYTGIYSAWNANLDGESGNDDPWDFGNNMQYPMLDYQGMSTDPQGGQAMGIPDNWNAPVAGERVGVCLTPDDFPNRARVSGESYYVGWVWERSDNGADWTDAVPLDSMGMPSGDPPAYNDPPTYEYTPTADDVGKYLRARMELSDGSVAYTRNLGGRVLASSDAAEGGQLPFVSGHAAPRVGVQIVAGDPNPHGASDIRFGWQRCPNTAAPHSDCKHIPHIWYTGYTPTADDVGSYLRMYVYYETSAGVWRRHETPFTTGVVAAR